MTPAEKPNIIDPSTLERFKKRLIVSQANDHTFELRDERNGTLMHTVTLRLDDEGEAHFDGLP